MLDQSLLKSNRQEKPYSDMLQIYRARIYSKPNPGDDRLQVRIMPQMADISNTAALPKYPPFFKGQVIVGITETEDKENADFVWVAALPDFTVGYILGLANMYETLNPKFSNSYNFKGLVEGLIQRGVTSSETSYKDMFVQYWTSTYIEMVNIKSGDKYMVMSNGTMIALTKNQIYLRVGAEDGEFSVIRLGRKDITFTTDHFKVNANTITLGNSGLYMAAMGGFVPTQAQGATIHPQTHIRL